MADNLTRTPLGLSLNKISTQKAADAIQLLGKALPATVVAVMGAIVKVNFEITGPFTLQQTVMPRAGSFYFRDPTQVGDKGFVVPADYYLGGMSGLGGGVANLAQRANLSTLVWFPIGNSGWPAAPDPNKALVQGPAGVVIQDIMQGCVMTITPTSLAITIGGMTATFSSSGLHVASGDVSADTISLKSHLTSEVASGGATSGPPVP